MRAVVRGAGAGKENKPPEAAARAEEKRTPGAAFPRARRQGRRGDTRRFDSVQRRYGAVGAERRSRRHHSANLHLKNVAPHRQRDGDGFRVGAVRQRSR